MAKKPTGPRLLRANDSPKLVDLRHTHEHYQRQAADAHAALAEAERLLAQAEQEVVRVEMAVLAGRATDADLAAAQSKLLDAKRAQATQFHRAGDADHLLTLLPASLAVALQEAKAEVAANLRADYQAALERLRDALLAAKAANDEVERIFDQALGEFSPDIHPQYHAAVCDLGEAGLTNQAAGLQPLNLPLFGSYRSGASGNSQLAVWLREAEAMLAALPNMAERDKAMRGRLEDNLVREAAEEQRRLAIMAEWDRRTIERYGLVPPPPPLPVPPMRQD